MVPDRCLVAPGALILSPLALTADCLRRVKNAGPNATPAPRIIGVDDWAIWKGQSYGTIIVDLERREAVELLPRRDGSELRTWLTQHPEIEVLCRDRWAPYTEAATAAAPQAQQIADRWHLLKNIRETLERFLDRHAGRIKAAFTPTIINSPDSNSGPETPAEALSPATAKQKQREAN
ncbi:transposase [Thalassoroseus pseudoceratinae]|uniref:transposase n=1 Tax=Thalassoroseus pseudoceratinae TaxID=2713176 RepID=UPI001F0EC125|nr:transposase [Thalassoroseus pseudoceratinae]